MPFSLGLLLRGALFTTLVCATLAGPASLSAQAHNGMRHGREKHLTISGHDVLVELMSPARYRAHTGLAAPSGRQVLWVQVLRARQSKAGVPISARWWNAQGQALGAAQPLTWKSVAQRLPQAHYVSGVQLAAGQRHRLELTLILGGKPHLHSLSLIAP